MDVWGSGLTGETRMVSIRWAGPGRSATSASSRRRCESPGSSVMVIRAPVRAATSVTSLGRWSSAGSATRTSRPSGRQCVRKPGLVAAGRSCSDRRRGPLRRLAEAAAGRGQQCRPPDSAGDLSDEFTIGHDPDIHPGSPGMSRSAGGRHGRSTSRWRLTAAAMACRSSSSELTTRSRRRRAPSTTHASTTSTVAARAASEPTERA